MQRLKEKANGDRVTVTKEQHLVDKCHPEYYQIAATKTVIIYRTALSTTFSPQAGRYGGRRDNSLGWVGC